MSPHSRDRDTAKTSGLDRSGRGNGNAYAGGRASPHENPRHVTGRRDSRRGRQQQRRSQGQQEQQQPRQTGEIADMSLNPHQVVAHRHEAGPRLGYGGDHNGGVPIYENRTPTSWSKATPKATGRGFPAASALGVGRGAAIGSSSSGGGHGTGAASYRASSTELAINLYGGGRGNIRSRSPSYPL